MHTAEESPAAVSQLCARRLGAMGGAPAGLAGARSRGTIDKACRRIRAVPASCLRKLADKFSSRGCGQRHLHPRHFQPSSHGLANKVCAAAGVFAIGTSSALLDPGQRRKQQTLQKKLTLTQKRVDLRDWLIPRAQSGGWSIELIAVKSDDDDDAIRTARFGGFPRAVAKCFLLSVKTAAAAHSRGPDEPPSRTGFRGRPHRRVPAPLPASSESSRASCQVDARRRRGRAAG